MALRRLASEVASKGLRYGATAPIAESASSFGLKALFARGYASGTSDGIIIEFCALKHPNVISRGSLTTRSSVWEELQ